MHILGDSQFPRLLFTLYPEEWKQQEYSHPPWMGLLQPVQAERFDQNRSSCAEMSVVRTIYHRRILDKREGKKKEINERVQKQGASVLHTTNRQDKHKTRSFQELN